MNHCKVLSSIIIATLLPSFLVRAQEEQWPPKNNGPAIAIIMGTEGIGGGPGYALWDLGREGRNLYVYSIFADTDYRLYYLDYSEPGLLKEGEKVDFTAFYQKRTGTHFFGVGPDAQMEDGAYYQRENYLFTLSYTLPFTRRFGASGGIGYDRTVIRESTLDDFDSFHADYEELDRPAEDVYPELFTSREFDDEFNHYWSVELWADFREGPPEFPVKGGYLRGSLARIDEANGGDWNYWRYKVEASLFVPVSDEYNVVGLRARWDRLDGKFVPFYKLPSLGQARFSTGFVTDTNAMRGVWENLWADRNRFLATIEFRHRVKAGWYPEEWKQTEFPFDFDPYRFVRNMAWFMWIDAGEVWPDDESMGDLKLSQGIGNVLYFDNGCSQQITIGFSENLRFYMMFTYGMQF